MSSDDEVKKLQEKVAALEAELKELKGRDLSPGKQHKMSAAKLETLEETGDEATQAYIKSQFVSRELSSGSVVASKDFRRAGNAIMAANKFKASGASAPAPAPVDPRNSHAVAAVVPNRFLPPKAEDSVLDEVLKIHGEIAAAKWDADTLTLCKTLKHPMAYVVSTILKTWNAAENLHVDEDTIVMMLTQLEDGYLATNPYHNATHACDVAYTVHVMLMSGVRDALQLTDLQCATCVIAAAAHDFRHPGIAATYLIAMSDDLALTYNDKSPLESMHCAEFFKMLKKKGSHIDIFANLPKKEQQDVRKTIIGAILATDMSVHFDYLDKFIKKFPAPFGPDAAALTAADQDFAISMLLHCADISNPAKPKDAYFDWTDRVLAEFYHQGDKEAESGLPVSNFFDRSAPSVAKMQTGFINFIVRPIFTAWCEFVPALNEMTMPHIESNAAIWKAETPYIPTTQAFVDAGKKDWDWEKGAWR